MDFQRRFDDAGLREELLDRFDEIAASATGTGAGAGGEMDGGFEGGEVPYSVDDAASAVRSMEEGTWGGDDRGLEAIIERFTRPVYMIQDSTFGPPPDDFVDSDFVAKRLEDARPIVDPTIPGAGRIDLRNHRKAWVGTGWMVRPNVVATNRHVAAEFSERQGDAFVFDTNVRGQQTVATVDWRHEHQRPDEHRFRVKRVIWIEPKPSFDVALLEIVTNGENDEPQPGVIELASADEIAAAFERWVAVLGYPAQDSRNDAADQQRIFDGIYNVKRLAPGKITAVGGDGIVEHDATTLGGCSGSPVIDLETGKALALHFGGFEGEQNYAVSAAELNAIIDAHL